jgi:lambda repressor-like predicted transcriptional regulator
MANHGNEDHNPTSAAIEEDTNEIADVKSQSEQSRPATPFSVNVPEKYSVTYPPFSLTMTPCQYTIQDIVTGGNGEEMANSIDWDDATIVAAIETAESALAAVERQLAQLHALQQRARNLQDFIALGRALLGEGSAENTGDSRTETEHISPEASLKEAVPRQKRTAAEYAKLVLETVQRPMRAAEIADYLEQRNLMEGQYLREVLRTAMRKHRDFERVAAGVYALEAWPREQKAVPEQGLASLSPPTTEHDANGNLNLQQPLTACIVELLETTRRPMTPVEIEAELVRRGRSMGRDSVSSALSRLKGEGRIERPESGKYIAVTL